MQMHFSYEIQDLTVHWEKHIVLGTHSQSSSDDVHVCANVSALYVNCASSWGEQPSQDGPVRVYMKYIVFIVNI